MAARKEIVCKVVSEGMSVSKAMAIAEVPRSSYYYRTNGKRRGKAPSTHTMKGDIMVENTAVVEEINSMLAEEFIDYGYERTTAELKNRGYQINKKKVYRLMKETSLLFPKFKIKASGRSFVKFTVPLVTKPFETIEIDFKYIYIEGLKRHAYLITMLDVFSRAALVWELNITMKASDAVRLVGKLIADWIPEPKKLSVKIRTDNGSQFIAENFRNCLQKEGISNEYTHPGTPEQNAHIESFHNTLDRLVCSRYSFDTVQMAQEILDRFFFVYNQKRIMKSILYMAPMEFLKQWSEGKISSKKEKRKLKYFLREKPTEHKSGGLPPDTFFLQSKNSQIFSNFINHHSI